ncbi:hypothetical protein [Paraburkholderia caballeronis]|uniref:Uncharacterized protein n=1 Tax=Paraburkholderia caballeronis TaxID=416943 RepID=A0A1H7MWW1_9BURK|nr:hypothetical protein [Paraburkholderia caballeronis]PXW26401.1 hypothetical protein C7403_104275 [Paraburkholderia caballeronis]PXX01948.1 hypothetical protein C7407_104275 [Paraburkholderia caballeronis]RAK01105.1 hypothetical protein C7409_104275 [Paraburkholderia caballeronis]SEB97801.1 hypothetical protein SAMN05445871_1420 [Paraburkholderia caballeronis]SEL15107.1 hypothetical protein SAMN05192542_105194 [Paraburkholderia caballeronis]
MQKFDGIEPVDCVMRRARVAEMPPPAEGYAIRYPIGGMVLLAMAESRGA